MDTFDKQTFTGCASKWADERAAQVLPADMLESFLKLDVEARVVGIGFFAALGNDKQIEHDALEILRTLQS
jgi:hypothetical protein